MFDEDAATPDVDARAVVASFVCPRCGAETDGAAFYGPCPTCRAQLAERWPGAARDVTTEDYEPKMNVTPNFVATKD